MMAMFFNKYLFFSVALLALANSASVDEDFNKAGERVLNSIKSSLTCVNANKERFTACQGLVANIMHEHMDIKPQIRKDFCCTFPAFVTCVKTVAENCTERANDTIQALVTSFTVETGYESKCADFDNVYECMDPMLRIVAIAGVILLAIIIVGVIVKYTCRCEHKMTSGRAASA